MNKLKSKIANAISVADSSYFNEDYSKQADAVLKTIANEGFVLLPKELAPEIWQQAADAMRTGRLRPDEHVKNVYETVLKTANLK